MNLFGWLKVWGVEFEFNLPPEFYITDHAYERLKQRLNVSDKKLKQVVVKAWHAPEVDSKKMNLAKYRKELVSKDKTRIFRELMGYIFVFSLGRRRDGLPRQKVLVTVF